VICRHLLCTALNVGWAERVLTWDGQSVLLGLLLDGAILPPARQA